VPNKSIPMIITAETALVTGVPKHMPNVVLAVNRAKLSGAQIVAAAKAHLALIAEIKRMRGELDRMLANAKAMRLSMSARRLAVKAYAVATFGAQSIELHALGFSVKKPAKPSAETRRAAVEKRLATRKARNTMGTKQRKAIKGTPPEPPRG
jgi:hypothetical protein